jgi:hypothetical protein
MAGRLESWSDEMVAMTIDDRGSRIARAIALLVFVVMVAASCAAQEKFRFPIADYSSSDRRFDLRRQLADTESFAQPLCTP